MSPAPPQLRGCFKDKQQPRLIEKAHKVVSMMASLTKPQLKATLSVSDSLASLNYERYKNYMDQESSPCIMAFDGQAFKGLAARGLSASEMGVCEQSLRVLSGVYGLLRPGDHVRPYRLEMGTKMGDVFKKDPSTKKMSTLYDWWGADVAQLINADLDAQILARKKEGDVVPRVVVNCASAEYWKSVNKDVLTEKKTDIVNIVFKGATVHVKEARGAFAKYMIVNDITERDDLKGFTGNNDEWHFNASASDENNLHFTRDGSGSAKPAAKKSKPAAPKKRQASVEAGDTGTRRTKRGRS